MTGTVKIFDPATGLGSLLRQSDLKEIEIARGAFAASGFRFLRQGQTLTFDLDDKGLATNLRFGSEGDMKTPTEDPNSR